MREAFSVIEAERPPIGIDIYPSSASGGFVGRGGFVDDAAKGSSWLRSSLRRRYNRMRNVEARSLDGGQSRPIQ
jgi:hypothetical protein